MINKNRDRGKYTFANINLLGRCNADCYFCLGKDISGELRGKNQLGIHFKKWKNFDAFLQRCKEEDIQKLYVTGQTADGLQYGYLDELVHDLQADGFIIGVRTNGYLAERKIKTIQKMKGGIGYSIHSLNPLINEKIMGRNDIPNWDVIIPASGPNVRVSIVLNRYNFSEFFDILRYLKKFDNIRYIQARRISTDTRLELLEKDVVLYEDFYQSIREVYPQTGEYYLSQQHDILGHKVFFWRTVETSVNSLNYFTDGVVSDQYFIVEGYLNNKGR